MKYIMLHHTGSTAPSISQARYLSQSKAPVSVQYTVWRDWKVWKHCDDNNVCRHAWIWTGFWIPNNTMNYHSIGIEVCSDWQWYSDKEKTRTRELVLHLMSTHGISSQNVIRHKDWTKRKRDISDKFWNDEYKTRKQYQDSLKTRTGDQLLAVDVARDSLWSVRDKVEEMRDVTNARVKKAKDLWLTQ